MKTCFPLGALSFALVLAAGATARAESAAPTAAAAPREFTIVVVDALGGSGPGRDIYDRIAQIFTEVFDAKKWPLKVSVERFGANAPAHETELRIYLQGVRQETPVDLTFSAWITLTDHGTKTDFGVIRYRCSVRMMEQMDDRLDRVVRGAALATVAKVEPVLFPK